MRINIYVQSADGRVCVCVFSGKTVDRGAVSEAAEEALELLEAFNIRSTQVSKAISHHFDEPAMSSEHI